MILPIAHGGGITAAAALYGGDPSSWLDLSTGINPNPVEMPASSAAVWHRLPDRSLDDAARLAARKYYGALDSLPLAAPGTQSVIQRLPGLADPDRSIAILGPTYGEYGRVFSRAGFSVDVIAEISAIRPGHGLVVVVNPNNPDGRIFSATALQALAQSLAVQNSVLVVDEAFADFDPRESLAGAVRDHANLVVLRSFGKFFGLAGLRLGFAIAAGPILDQLAEELGPWAVSGPALSIAATLMGGDIAPIRDAIATRKAALDRALSVGGLSVVGGTALFCLVDDDRAGELHSHLCRAQILTRKFDYAPRWLRFGLSPDDDGDARLEAALLQWGAL
ncbi:MAG: threonine-phosphate decarboxylase CobD [Allorhizobium sp.]